MAGDGPPPTGVELNTSSILNATNATDRECEELSASQRAELPLFDPQRLKDPTYARVELYCAATLIFVCAVSVLNNACVLLSTCWIKRRPLSTTMRISLSLTGADTTASFFLGVSWFINNILHQMVPPAPDTFKPMSVGGRCMLVAPERLTCLILALEALRLGAVLVTMLHLLALAANHYLGALRPLQSHVRHAYLVVGLAAIWIVPEATLFVYFSSFEGDGFRTEGSQCGYEFLKTYNFHITFSLIFFFVLVLMICIYVHIYIIVQRHERNRHRFRRTGSSHQRAELKHLNGATHKQAQAEWSAEVEAQAQEPNGGTHSSNSLIATSLLRTTRSRRGGSPQFRRNKKAIVTTLYILGSYLIGWMPAVVSFMLVCDKECAIPRETLAFDSVYTVLVFWSFNMLIVIKTLANSFIYTSRMKEIKEARHSMCNALARRCCRFLPQSTDPVRGALFGGAPTESTQQPVRSERLSVYSHSRNSTRRLNGLAHGQGRRRDHQLAQSDV